MARAADRNEALPSESTISFEDPADVVKLITTARLALFRAIKEMPGSITQISARLHRDRSANRIGARTGEGKQQIRATSLQGDRTAIAEAQGGAHDGQMLHHQLSG